MTATELRIGNLIDTLEGVTMITGIHANGTFTSEEYDGGDLLAFAKPIPLTEEWLLKFGFEETYNSEFRKRLDHPCNFIGYDFSKTSDKSMEGLRYYGHYIECKYVHQLQNLYYALTNSELTIKEP